MFGVGLKNKIASRELNMRIGVLCVAGTFEIKLKGKD